MNLHMMTKILKSRKLENFDQKFVQTIWDELSWRIWFECESCRNLQDEWKEIEWWEKIRENKRGKDKTRQDKTRQDKTRQDKTKRRQREE